jgi:hypothetical protein
MAAIAAVAVIVLWVLFYVKFSAYTGRRGEQWPVSWLVLAILATVGAPAWILTQRRNLSLLRDGMEVSGRVVSVSPLRKGGMRPVTYAYVVDGVEYKFRRDTPVSFAKHYQPGSPVRLVVDPAHPKRAMVFDHGDDE